MPITNQDEKMEHDDAMGAEGGGPTKNYNRRSRNYNRKWPDISRIKTMKKARVHQL